MKEKIAGFELIDTHCHLYLEEFAGDLDTVIARARTEGVSQIYLPSLDSAHLQGMIALQDQYPELCFSMVGIHPCYVKENYEDELETMKTKLGEKEFAGVGEIGLDYYWDKKFDKYQMISFLEQLKMARNYDLPVVIHSRSSMDETIEVLQKEVGMKGIFHCFSGTVKNALDIINCGFLLGIGGVVTYKNAGLDKVIAELPLDKLVLETDAPYLTPVPFRGKRNESSYLKYIAAKIAEIKNISIEEVASVTTANAKMIFG
jgi:TatD DNase family protein